MRTFVALLWLLALPGAAAAGERPGAHLERCVELEHSSLQRQVLEDKRQRDFALFDAAARGCAKLARALLEAGATPAARNGVGNTPLHVAAEAGHVELVELLLDSGAEIDRPNLRGQTPLLKAVAAERRRVVRLLLRRGADAGHADGQGIAPVTAAAFNGDVRTVEWLLAAGVDPDPVDRTGKSPIVYASARGFADIVGRLLDAGVDPARRYGHDLTALMWAAGYSNDVPAKDALETAALLIARGAPLDARDDRGMTALDIAIGRDHDEMAALLRSAAAGDAPQSAAR